VSDLAARAAGYDAEAERLRKAGDVEGDHRVAALRD
jgi:hypothetical protein